MESRMELQGAGAANQRVHAAGSRRRQRGGLETPMIRAYSRERPAADSRDLAMRRDSAAGATRRTIRIDAE